MRFDLSMGLATVALRDRRRGVAAAVAALLPAVGVPPAGAYGVRRLVAGHGGPALRVVRASDGAARDIALTLEGSLDVGDAATFAGSATLSVATWYDQSGQGRDLTAAVGARPTLWLGAGGPTITNFTVAAPFTIPPLAADRRALSVFLAARTPSQAIAVGMWEFGDFGGVSDIGLRSYATRYGMQPIVDGVSPLPTVENYGAVNIAGMSVMSLVSSPARLRIRRDDQAVDYAAVSARAMTAGGRLGTTSTVPNGRFDLAAFVVYPAALTDVEEVAVRAVLKVLTGAADTGAVAHIFQGDSITFGTGAVNNRTISAEVGMRLPASHLIRNIGIAGQQAAAQVALWDTAPQRFSLAGGETVLRLHIGRNDVANDASADAVATSLRRITTAARARGAATKIVGVTATASVVGVTPGWTASREAERLRLNDWLRSDPVDDNGMRCFDAIDDLAADPVIGDAATLAGGGFALASVSADHLHPNESVIASRMAPSHIAALQAIGIVPAVTTVVGTPSATQVPVASGAGSVGAVLACTPGGWSSVAGAGVFTVLPNAWRYRWTRNGATIAGAERARYTVVAADAGATIACVVTASNAAGSASVASNGIAVSSALAIAATPVTTATQGSAYPGFAIDAAGGTAPYVFSIATGYGALPPGVTLSTIDGDTASIAGTPTAAGSFTDIVARVVDAAGTEALLAPFTLTVATSVAGAIDGMAASAAYGLRRLRGDYAGAAIRVRRSSDAAVIDVGFDTGGNLDTVVLAAFIGSASGFVDTWYDQAGGGLHFTQATAASQPRIVNAGAVETRNGKPAILFASAQGMTGALSASVLARTVVAVASHNNASNGDLLVPSANGGRQMRFTATHALALIKTGTGTIATSTGVVATGVLATLVARFDGSAYAFQIDGAAAGSGAATQSFTAGLTSKLGSASGINLHLGELIVFEGTPPGMTAMAALQADQKAFWGTP